ncbi:MAG TPA: hypothetical protein VF976_02485 [Gemmatimonadales bacterium]
MSPQRPVVGRARAAFRAVATTIVPEAGHLGPSEWDDVEAIIGRALAGRPPRLRRQLALLLVLLEWLPLLRYGRRLSRLDPARRLAFLERVEAAPLVVVRRGFWGLRTLILMGYYGRPAAAAAIGYRADPRGWEVRR